MGDDWLLKNDDNYCAKVASFYYRVFEWNKVAGNDYRDPDLIPLYRKLVEEERLEAQEAYKSKDAAEFCKELADRFVVTSFLLMCEEPDMIEDLMYPSYVNSEGAYTLSETIWEKQDCTEYELAALESAAADLDVDFGSILHEVMDSNFSKFVSVHEAVAGWGGDLAPVCKMIEENSKGRYTGVTSLESSGYIIFRDSSGKILKAPSYFEARVERFIPKKWLTST